MSNRPGDVLSRLCIGAQQIVVVAPYIKADALARILANVGPSAILTCVTRWNPHDLALGASDAECRTIVTERGGSFRLHPSLHAKYYRIDDVILIGSANLTASALGWSPQPNLEILCRAGDDFDACIFEQELMKSAREINDKEFARWSAISQIKSRNDAQIFDRHDPLATWMPSTRDPRNLELAYQDREDDIASYDEQQAAQRDLQHLQFPPGMTADEVCAWTATCLFAAPFTSSVMRLQGMEVPAASRLLADSYSLNVTEARRHMETVTELAGVSSP